MDTATLLQALKSPGLPDVIDFDSVSGKAILTAAEGLARSVTPPSSVSVTELVKSITQPGALLAAAAEVQRASDDTGIMTALAQFIGKPGSTRVA